MRFSSLIAGALCLGVATSAVRAQVPSQVSVFTFTSYEQTSSTTSAASLEPVLGLLEVAGTLSFVPAAPVSVTVASPAGLILPLTYNSSTGGFSGSAAFASMAQMYEEIATGVYNLDVTGNSGIISSTPVYVDFAGQTPAPVLISNFAALQAATSGTVTVTWPPLGLSTGDSILLEATDVSGNVLSQQSVADGALMVNSTQGTLTGLQPGVPATISLGYSHMVASQVGATTLIAVYSQDVEFSLTVAATPPAITAQPVGGTAALGSTFIFSVQASAAAGTTISYQWQKNGFPITGATSATYQISGAQTTDGGTYSVAVKNQYGSVTSNNATLTVTQTSNPGRIINLSIRTVSGTDANVLAAGFVVGSGASGATEPVLVRGIGPTLGSYGVTGFLADPTLQLAVLGAPTALSTDDNWGGGTQLASVFSATGAFALPASSLDAAIYSGGLAQGAYTATVAGNNGGTGVALAEVYDATPGSSYTPSMPHLINVSGRSNVGTGINNLVGGFTIGGSTSKTVLIRASGPALVPYGVPGTLATPELDLYSGTTLMATNTAWAGDPNIVAAAAEVGAFMWPNGRSADCALLVTLPPGGYSAQVSGQGGTTGVALLEIYELP